MYARFGALLKCFSLTPILNLKKEEQDRRQSQDHAAQFVPAPALRSVIAIQEPDERGGRMMTLSDSRIRLEIDGSLAVITLCRPEKLNALDRLMVAALGRAG